MPLIAAGPVTLGTPNAIDGFDGTDERADGQVIRVQFEFQGLVALDLERSLNEN